MRKILCVLAVMVITVLVVGCDSAPFQPASDEIIGGWTGISVMGYPGPADEPLADTVEVYLSFDTDGFTIYPRESGVPVPVMPPEGLEGEYSIQGSDIYMTMYSQPIVDHPMNLYGKFSMELNGSSLRLYQVEHPEIWPVYKEVRLERSADK